MHDTEIWTISPSPTLEDATTSLVLASSSAAIQIATVILSSLPTSLPTHSLASAIPPNSTMIPISVGSPVSAQENTGKCELLGPFAILVQAALGGLALLSLVFKRWRERPQRPLKVWAFDASKQVFGSVLLHLANLVMSMFSAGEIQASLINAAASTVEIDGKKEKYIPNPCSFYLLNLAIDTTVGIPILIVILRLLQAGFALTPVADPTESILSGHYGQPPKATWWLKQSMIYFIGLLGMKACVFVIFQLCPWIIQVGDWALRWTEGNEAYQIAFVMLIFPLIMNAMQYYIIDGFIKSKPKPESEVRDSDEDQDSGEDGALLAVDLEESQDNREEAERREDKVNGKPSNVAPVATRRKSYDPDKDGEVPTPTEASSSTASNVEAEAMTGKPTR